MFGSSQAIESASAPIFKFAGNANNYSSIYGASTTASTYTLQLRIQPYITIVSSCNKLPNVNGGSVAISSMQSNHCIIKALAPTSLNVLDKEKMGLLNIKPNLVTSLTTIKYDVEYETNATITIYKTLGAIVQEYEAKTIIGENKLVINASSLANDTYIYTLKYKNAIDIKRMVVINH